MYKIVRYPVGLSDVFRLDLPQGSIVLGADNADVLILESDNTTHDTYVFRIVEANEAFDGNFAYLLGAVSDLYLFFMGVE